MLLRSKSTPALTKWFLLLTPLVFLGAVTFLADDLGIRYIIPALPFAYLLGASGCRGVGDVVTEQVHAGSDKVVSAADALGVPGCGHVSSRRPGTPRASAAE